MLLFSNHCRGICGCVIRADQKNQKSHYESRGWYHYTCLHSNCPLNIVLLQQHVFIISEHPNGSNIIRNVLNGILVLCLGLSDKSRATNGLLISVQVTEKDSCLIQSHCKYVVAEGKIPHHKYELHLKHSGLRSPN